MQNAKEDAGHRQWISVERWLQYKGLRHTNDQRLVVMVGGRLHIVGQIIIGRGWHHDKSMRVSSLILQRLNQKNNEDRVMSCHVMWHGGWEAQIENKHQNWNPCKQWSGKFKFFIVKLLS